MQCCSIDDTYQIKEMEVTWVLIYFNMKSTPPKIVFGTFGGFFAYTFPCLSANISWLLAIRNGNLVFRLLIMCLIFISVSLVHIVLLTMYISLLKYY